MSNKDGKTPNDILSDHVNKVKCSDNQSILNSKSSDIQCNFNFVKKSDTQCTVIDSKSDKCEFNVYVPDCKCDNGSHVGTKVQELGQNSWAGITKKQLMQIDTNLLHNRCQDLCDFMCQQNEHTGFIPLSPLQFVHIKQCEKNVVDPDLCQDPVKLHKYVNSFKCPNFLGARVQVNFDMNLDLVDLLAKDYWGWQLPLYLRYGFPMDFKGKLEDLTSTMHSHASARQHPEHVKAYLQDEINHRAIFGPFHSEPFGQDTHVSPFITRSKQDSEKGRVIIDLSWPPGASVNDFTDSNEYRGTAFKLTYPSVDSFTDRLRQLENGALMHKIDLSRAFRQWKVDPADFPLSVSLLGWSLIC